MKLFNDFQSYQLNFSGCYLDYFKLIIIHFNHFMQLRETLITVQNQTAHCQIIIRFRQVEPESLIYLFYFQTGRKHIFTFTQLLTYIGRIIMLILNIAGKFLPPNPPKRRYPPYHRIRPPLQQSIFFCCMNSFISLWADIVSGTIGTSFTLFLQSTGFLNISDE